MAEVTGGIANVTSDGFTVSSNTETADEIRENLESEAKPEDGEPADPEKEKAARVSKAAAELGKKGGEAAAAKRKDDVQGDGGDEPKEGEKPLGKPRDDPRARIKQQSDQLRAEREERTRLAAENAEIKARLERIERGEAPQAKPAAGDPQQQRAASGERPKEEDFDNYADYVDALTDYKVDQKLKTAQHEAEGRAFAKKHADGVVAHVDGFRGRIAAAGGDDFLATVDPRLLELKPSFMLPPNERPGPRNHFIDEVMASEHTAALMLHFTEHPEDVRRVLSQPNPRALAREVGRIEARFAKEEGAPAPKKAPGSNAKPPIKPISASAQASDDVDDDTSFEDHYKTMNARERKGGRR